MKLTSDHQDKISKAMNYVATGYNINKIFLVIAIIEAIVIGIGLYSLEFLSVWMILVVILGVIGTSYVLYVMFATVISILEQLSVNNELLGKMLEKEVTIKGATESIRAHSAKAVERKQVSKEKPKVERIIMSDVSIELKDNEYIGSIIREQSESQFEFETAEGIAYILNSKDSLEEYIGETIKIEALPGGITTLRTPVGKIAMNVLDLKSIVLIEGE